MSRLCLLVCYCRYLGFAKLCWPAVLDLTRVRLQDASGFLLTQIRSRNAGPTHCRAEEEGKIKPIPLGQDGRRPGPADGVRAV